MNDDDVMKNYALLIKQIGLPVPEYLLPEEETKPADVIDIFTGKIIK